MKLIILFYLLSYYWYLWRVIYGIDYWIMLSPHQKAAYENTAQKCNPKLIKQINIRLTSRIFTWANLNTGK